VPPLLLSTSLIVCLSCAPILTQKVEHFLGTLADFDVCASAACDVPDEQHLQHLLRQPRFPDVGSLSIALEEYDEVGDRRHVVGVHMSRWMDKLLYCSSIGQILTENYGGIADDSRL
jgi:hypothetical protein